MKEIRFTGIPIRIEEKITRQDYYPEEPGEIMDNPCITEAKNIDGFTRLLYYPQFSEITIHDEIGTRVIKTVLATTLMVETEDKTVGRKKWKTVGHIYGVKDSELEGLGFQKWKASDYDYKIPDSRIDIIKLTDKTVKELNEWLVAQGLKPIDNKKSPSDVHRRRIKV